ncbi:hypothetical protein BCU64_001180 [Vibrio lentus]|nr:hypothetical protein [Vibrio lentus]
MLYSRKAAGYVCMSACRRKPSGFWSAEPEPGNERPESWCSACEDKVNSDGGEWNDESEAFAGVTLLCGACYDRAKEMNVKN